VAKAIPSPFFPSVIALARPQRQEELRWRKTPRLTDLHN
jgi:hypothetical protein